MYIPYVPCSFDFPKPAFHALFSINDPPNQANLQIREESLNALFAADHVVFFFLPMLVSILPTNQATMKTTASPAKTVRGFLSAAKKGYV